MDIRYNVIDSFCHLLKKYRRFPFGYNKKRYIKYITSKAWEKTRARILKLRGYKCELCGEEVNLRCHHMAYGNIEKEKDYELSVLCKHCHTTSHFLTTNKISLPSPSVNRQKCL